MDVTKWPTRVDVSLNHNTINQFFSLCWSIRTCILFWISVCDWKLRLKYIFLIFQVKPTALISTNRSGNDFCNWHSVVRSEYVSMFVIRLPNRCTKYIETSFDKRTDIFQPDECKLRPGVEELTSIQSHVYILRLVVVNETSFVFTYSNI